MKKFSKYIFTLAALALATTACLKEEEYQKGAADVEGCYGVYFPTQEVLGANTVEPGAETTMKVLVARTVSDDDITVPITVKGDTDVITIEDAVFVDGQSETEVVIDFTPAQLGTTYKVELSIDNPKYASAYNDNATHAYFSVLIDKYVLMGKGLLRDDLITALYGAPNAEYEVEIYTKDSAPGFYYLKNAYTSLYPYNEEGDYVTEDRYFVVDASNPNQVKVPYQSLGMDWGEGDFYVASFTNETFNIDPSQCLYGTLANKIITFPVKSILISMENLLPSFYYANGSGLFRICLPGAILTDYTATLVAGQSSQGLLPVQFTLGVDVASVKYAAFEGALYATQVAKYAEEIVAGTTASHSITAEELAAASNTVAVSFEETGVYTVVAVTYDAEGKAQKSGYVSFSYVAAGDEVPVVCTVGLGGAGKYVPAGVNTDNALEYWVYGKDLESVKIGFFSAQDLAKDEEACIAAVAASKSVDAEKLEAVNGTGLVSVVDKLNPGTEYYLLAVASNGYQTKVLISEGVFTTGDPHPVYMSFTLADLSEDLIPESSEGYFGTYNYYAKSLDESGEKLSSTRTYQGQIVLSDSSIPDSEPDGYGIVSEFVNVNGLIPFAKSLGLKENTVFEYYNGVLYTGPAAGSYGQDNYYNFYSYLYHMDSTTGKYYNANLIGGFVEEGYLAFVNLYADQGLNITALSLVAFGDEAMSDYKGEYDIFNDILLVKPEKDDSGLAPAPDPDPSTSSYQFKTISKTLAKGPTNYVETPSGNFRSIVDQVRNQPTLCGNLTAIQGERDVKAVDFKVSADVKVQQVTRELKNLDNSNISLR